MRIYWFSGVKLVPEDEFKAKLAQTLRLVGGGRYRPMAALDEFAVKLAQTWHLAEMLRRTSADAFQDGGDALPRPDAHRRQTEPGVASDHGMNERGGDTRPRRP